MAWDHCGQTDATEPFDMPNGRATTTSAIEWRFVVEPLKGADGQGAPFSPYPTPERSRLPHPFDVFEAELEKRNRTLAKLGEPPVGRVEFFAARLYTGPVRPTARARMPNARHHWRPLPSLQQCDSLAL